MEDFDLIVIGSGSGMNVVERAVNEGMRVALVENGPLGGTCLNRGCIPSKMWIYPADVVRMIQNSEEIGIHAKIEGLDFNRVNHRMWNLVLEDRHHMEEAVKADARVKLFNITGYFIGPKALQVGPEQIKAPKIMIVAGARTRVPSIPGLKEGEFFTSESIFSLDKIPAQITILGGGYKACEMAHFFSAFGSKVIIIQHNRRLLPKEEPEMSNLAYQMLSKYVEIHLNMDVLEIKQRFRGRLAVCKDRDTEKVTEIPSETLLLGTGEQSNADILRAEAGGIKTDPKGFIVVNEYLETSMAGVWAFGDITGKHMFRHTANYESQIAWHNAISPHKAAVDEHAIPHAVYTYPTLASVGMTQVEAQASGLKILVGYNRYSNVAKGNAMAAEGLVKVVLDKATYRILGASIAGPEADTLVQSITYLMNCGDRTYNPLAFSQAIHPSLSEVLIGAFAQLVDPEELLGKGSP